MTPAAHLSLKSGVLPDGAAWIDARGILDADHASTVLPL